MNLEQELDLTIDNRWVTRILEDFIRTEIGRTGTRKVVVGLSGGLDSTVASYLAARALGPDAVLGLLMPYRDSSPESVRDADRVVKALGIRSERIDITPMVDGFEAVTATVDSLRSGNVMARCRMIMLYDRSAAGRSLVLGTSNKTELLLGYGTLHGDMASAVNPIGDLYKTQVRSLARYLKVPAPILRKPPSADLWPDQTDEDELGFTYEEVDRLLKLLVDARVSPETAVKAGFSEEMVERVRQLLVRSHFKRRLPVIAKVSTRSVGWDFRYPRDWRT